MAGEIGGPATRVENLTSPGVEPHDLELSPHEVDRVESAPLVLVLGGDFQPAVERVAKRNPRTVALFGGAGEDPHVWLDPVLMGGIVDRTRDALVRAYPAARAAFEQRAVALHARIDDLYERYRAGLATCDRREIVTSHRAFGRLAARYELTQVAIAGFSPEAEPDPRRLAELSDLIKQHGVTTVFTEELVSRRVARTLARETGARTEVLSPLETAPRRGDYITAMDANLQKLRRALACR